jgi:hypothetical protein
MKIKINTTNIEHGLEKNKNKNIYCSSHKNLLFSCSLAAVVVIGYEKG